ncbi:MAG: (d)CMP kinase [Devosia sp.]
MIIAVDGPAASGKGTLSRRLAGHFGLSYLDTGRTYRAVAALLREGGLPLDAPAAAVSAAEALDLEKLDALDLTNAEVAEAASKVAVMPQLRTALVARQRAFAQEAERTGSGAVLDGRDIGTVVCPDASVKIFVTAAPEARARRRALELFGTDKGAAYEQLLDDLKIRDARDANRPVGALRPADDAHVLDTTLLSISAALDAAIGLVENARAD